MNRKSRLAMCGLLMAMSFIVHLITGKESWMIIGSVFLAACLIIETKD